MTPICRLRVLGAEGLTSAPARAAPRPCIARHVRRAADPPPRRPSTIWDFQQPARAGARGSPFSLPDRTVNAEGTFELPAPSPEQAAGARECRSVLVRASLVGTLRRRRRLEAWRARRWRAPDALRAASGRRCEQREQHATSAVLETPLAEGEPLAVGRPSAEALLGFCSRRPRRRSSAPFDRAPYDRPGRVPNRRRPSCGRWWFASASADRRAQRLLDRGGSTSSDDGIDLAMRRVRHHRRRWPSTGRGCTRCNRREGDYRAPGRSARSLRQQSLGRERARVSDAEARTDGGVAAAPPRSRAPRTQPLQLRQRCTRALVSRRRRRRGPASRADRRGPRQPAEHHAATSTAASRGVRRKRRSVVSAAGRDRPTRRRACSRKRWRCG